MSARPDPTSKTTPKSADAAVVLQGLIERMAARDEAALADFYDCTSRLVYGLTLRVLRHAETAEEVMIDVYHQAWRQAARFDGRRGAPHTWLLSIARSRAIDRLRSLRQTLERQQPLSVTMPDRPASDPMLDEMVALGDRQERIRAAVQQLDPAQARAISLAYFEGYSHAEIAQQLDLPLGTVKTRIRLGMQQLGRKLQFMRGEL